MKLVTRILEYGFTRPSGSPEGISDDGRWMLVCVPGVEHTFQFARVVATDPATATDRELIVIHAYLEAADEIVNASVAPMAEHFGRDALVVFVREDRTGWARITCGADASDELAAAATAVVKASGGWDESDPITIVCGTSTIDVSMEFRDKDWHADVRPRK
jgi:hypothetical protein